MHSSEYKVVKDSKWKYSSSANPRRGLHDYCRLIEFDKELSEEEKKEVTKRLDEEENCPAGQGRVISRRTSNPNELSFSCFLDSSD